MARGQSGNKVQHLKPSPPRKPTKHKRVEKIEQFYQPHSQQPVTLPIVKWLASKA
jgi:hypothetical protein